MPSSTPTWRDSYAIGEPTIDDQHRRLFDLSDQLLLAADQPQLTAAMMALYQYVRTHFGYEEALMRRIGYFGYAGHRALHETLIERLNALAAEIAAGHWQPHKLKSFMNDWLLVHIAEHDRQLARHLAASPTQS